MNFCTSCVHVVDLTTVHDMTCTSVRGLPPPPPPPAPAPPRPHSESEPGYDMRQGGKRPGNRCAAAAAEPPALRAHAGTAFLLSVAKTDAGISSVRSTSDDKKVGTTVHLFRNLQENEARCCAVALREYAQHLIGQSYDLLRNFVLIVGQQSKT